MSRAEQINNIDSHSEEYEPCGACGLMVRETRFGALYAPAGTSEFIAYILCDPCGVRVLDEATREEVWAAVELRLGPVKGAA